MIIYNTKQCFSIENKTKILMELGQRVKRSNLSLILGKIRTSILTKTDMRWVVHTSIQN